MPQEQIDSFSPDVFAIINAKLARNRRGLKSYLEKLGTSKAAAHIFNFNSSEGIQEIMPASIDIIITSPPYGDSRTTVAYGQFSRLANQWLGIEQAAQVDSQLMGGTPKMIQKTNIAIIDESVERVANMETKRAQEVYSFYEDYRRSIANVATVLKPKGHACYVVGNRRVKDVVLPTDEITQTLFEQCGFSHVNTFIRNIPNKRMPNKNSPTNKVGHTAPTMNNEYIVVMQKN